MMIVFRLLSVFTGLQFVESGYIFTLFGNAPWEEAISMCESSDRKLAVLDTPEKLAALQEQGINLGGEPWVGFSTNSDGDYVWLNGNVLSRNHPNWISRPGVVPNRCGYLAPSGQFQYGACDYSGKFVCEEYACDPGFYITGNLEKCVMCTGNTIKTRVGNATDCDEDEPCDGVTSVPNSEHTTCICNAGYYKSGSSCELCTGNKIKTSVGDAPDCDADTTCDGVSEVPNADHTACVKNDFAAVNGIRSTSYSLKQRNSGITSAEVASLKVRSTLECSMECFMRGCKEFSFQHQAPDGGKCSMIMDGNITYQPPEGDWFS